MQQYSFFIFILLFSVIFFIQAPNVNSQTYPYNARPDNRENVLIILDSSFSMDQAINGEKKIDIAKRVIRDVLGNLPSNVWVGLRVYGHKADFLGINACKASELKVPVGQNNQSLINNELAKIRPVGWTPISYSLQQAISRDFTGLTGKRRIILVSDGMETCNGSPCDFAVNLARENTDIKIDVIGFDLDEPAAMSQLKCTALATKGKFFAANSAQELSDSLSKSLNVSKEVQGVILNK